MKSQQTDSLGAIGSKGDAQEKFLQLDKGKHGYSDRKLANYIMPQLNNVTTYLNNQSQDKSLVSAKTDQAVRYLKYMAATHNDYEFKHLDDYAKSYVTHMNNAYGVVTGSNFIMDKQNVPLEDNQMMVLASHGANEVRRKLLAFKTPDEVDAIMVNNQPRMVSSPGGRISMVFPNGQLVPDEHGHPAFNEIYTESVWRQAESDTKAEAYKTVMLNPIFGRPTKVQDKSVMHYLRSKPAIIRPEVEGNIQLEHLPKVWKDNGEYEILKTITSEIDGKTVLLPTIINGKEVTNKKAIEHYKKTGEHLGVFKTREEADTYDEQMHQRMGWTGVAKKWGKK